MRYFLVLTLWAALHVGQTTSAQAQVAVGQCQSHGGPFLVYDLNNGTFLFQHQLQGWQFTGSRDPTGIVFIGWQLPGMPAQEFINWQGQVIRIQPGGWVPIGQCQFQVHYQAPQFNIQIPLPGQYGVIYGDNHRRIPDQFVRHGNVYLPPLMASENTAKECIAQYGADHENFVDCLNRNMLSKDQIAAYDCYQENKGDETAFGLCVVKIGMGQAERKAVDDIYSCYQQHRNDWQQYPTCYFAESNDPNVARAAQCLQRQAGMNASFWGFAGCYGSGALGANAEVQVAAECAATTGGQPYAFAACTGGRLTAAEIDKCWNNGVGGENGCFGQNNTIVQYLRQLGVDTDRLLNRNGAVINAFNTIITDLRNGPGPNNDGIRIINNIGREIERAGQAGNNIKEEANRGLKRLGLPFQL
ncbi:MAG: hypothetical protein FD139_161 [Methylocystaceae bacterium]|nr:MAG: hypothetical protein FD172_1019 [Methylocystaceae bacterium]TXT48239.1 MAG: hypothetical protein FD139_161 [Methylocystaceae bacterium]